MGYTDPGIHLSMQSEINDIDDTTTHYSGATNSSGNVIIYLTNDATPTGNALYTAVSHVQPYLVVADPQVAYGQYIISGDLKTLTIPCSKMSFNGVTVLGISVLGSITTASAPAGINLFASIIGKLA